jgi:type I restriction enzyme M protein
MKILRAGGSAGIVIKNTFLSNTDNASIAIRKELLESHNLHTILDCPSGTFQGAGVKTVVLFFKKGEPTKKIWYYQLTPGRNMGKTNPLNDKDLEDFIELQKSLKSSDISWTVETSSINQDTWDLSVKNPNKSDEVIHLPPMEIITEIEALDQESQAILKRIKNLL